MRTPPKLKEYMGSCVLSLTHGSKLRSSNAYLNVKTLSAKKKKKSLISARVRVLGWPLLVLFFPRDFSNFFVGVGGLGGISFIWNI